jgi:hypothetical protein
MASLFVRRAVLNAQGVLNSSPPPSTTFLRPVFGYYKISPFTSHTDNNNNTHSNNSLHIDLSNEESKRSLFNRFVFSIFLFLFNYDKWMNNPCVVTDRLLYRSKQRGFLELDLVLGKWVENNIHSLDENQIRSLIHVLDVVCTCFHSANFSDNCLDNQIS